MSAPAASILPPSFFDGLSALWGGCAYLASAIVTAGLVVQVVRSRPDAGAFIWLLAKVFLIGLSTVFLREWLMRLNDIVITFNSLLGVDPRSVDRRFVEFIAGKTATDPNSSIWDIIWGTESVGTAFCYAFLWLFGWIAWGVQYVVKLIGDVLLVVGWALSPIFLSFYMLRPMVAVAQKYVVGLVALVLWPFGWTVASVITNAMLQAAAVANLVPVFNSGSPLAVPALTVLLIGSWMLVSTVLAPWIITKIFLMGANPAMAFAQGVGGVAQAAFVGGVGAAVAAVTGGAAAPAVIAATAGGTMMAGAESAARGGESAQTTNTALRGLAGFYAGNLARRHTEAAEGATAAQRQRSAAAQSFASEFSGYVRQRQSRSGFDHQPHDDDPNQAAIEIESHAKLRP
jgi:type IV secretion system protein TrbL